MENAGTPGRGRRMSVITRVTRATSRLLEEMESLKGCFTGATVDFRTPCTASEDRMCHVVPKLSAWNELLFAARFELRELPGTFGKLSLEKLYEPSYEVFPHFDDYEFVQGGLVINWLIARHPCVISFQAAKSFFDYREVGLCSALRKNSWLKFLKLEWSDRMTSEVCSVVERLTSLEEFECSGSTCFPEALADALQTLIRSSSCLVALRLYCLAIFENKSKTILEAVVRSHTLKEFVLSGFLVRGPYHVCPPRYQTIGSALTTLQMPIGSKRMQTFLLEDIAENRTVRKLTLTSFITDEESVILVAKIFRKNNVLLRLNLISPLSYLGPEHQAVFDSWLEALGENCTLEELTLPLVMWSLPRWATLFQALSSRLSLKKLHIERSLSPADILPSLCSVLTATGAEEKVSLGHFDVMERTGLIKCKSVKQVYLHLQGCEVFRNDVLRQLPECSHLTRVAIRLSGEDPALSSAMANYLRVTSQLEELDLHVVCPHESVEPSTRWTVIFDALSQNMGVRKLGVFLDSPNREDYEELADAVTRSRSFRIFGFEGRSHAYAGVFLRRLSMSIADNYTLLRVGIRWPEWDADFNGYRFAISDTTRRNFCLSARAARFVKAGVFDRHVATALERIYRYPALMEELATLSEATKTEIFDSVRDRLRSIRRMDDFMRFTGVVRDRVTCHPRDDGHTQLDDLNEDCWAHVRRYLKADDVNESATLVQKT
ncbi:uncharacterized protein LOC144108379 [Amblyomma americanum]